MSKRLFVRYGSAAAAVSLALLAAGPALAADPVAQASATALELAIAGQGTDTGTFTATNDGTTQTTSGTNTPALPLLAGQQMTNLGTLAQDATTTVTGGNGTSAACAGVAGEGATLVQVGDGTSCLRGGQTITLDAAHADFSKLRVLPADYTQGFDTALAAAVQTALSPVLQPLLAGLGDSAIGLDLGAVQSSCTASATSAQGTANIAKAQAYLQAPQPIGRIVLADLPVNPAPNTHVPTDLSAVVEAIQQGLDTQIANALGGSSGTLGPLLGNLGSLDTLIDQVQHNVTDALGPQLTPLQDNVLDIVLNKQSRPSSNAIEVTALDASVLPAARQFVSADLAHLTIGRVACGPNRALAPASAAVPAVDTPAADTPDADTAVPTAVKSGAGSLEDQPSPLAVGGLGGLVLAGTGLAIWGFRRSLRA